MVAATTQIQWYGNSPTEPAGVTAQDSTGIIFNREDSKAGTAVSSGVPIPMTASTAYSWPKLVALVVTVAGTTNIANRRFSLAGAMPVGSHWYVRGRSAYLQPGPLADNSTADAVVPPQTAPTAAPTLSAAGSGGSMSAQTVWVKVTYVGFGGGETTPSPVASQVVVANGVLTINSPPSTPGASGWYAYVGTGATEPADGAKFRQQAAGSPTALGAALVLSADPTATGANPPVVNTALAFVEATPTTTPVYDTSSVSTASTGRNGGFCEMVTSLDSTFQRNGGVAGTIPLPPYRLMYDEAACRVEFAIVLGLFTLLAALVLFAMGLL